MIASFGSAVKSSAGRPATSIRPAGTGVRPRVARLEPLPRARSRFWVRVARTLSPGPRHAWRRANPCTITPDASECSRDDRSHVTCWTCERQDQSTARIARSHPKAMPCPGFSIVHSGDSTAGRTGCPATLDFHLHWRYNSCQKMNARRGGSVICTVGGTTWVGAVVVDGCRTHLAT
jgi:hypothetical protein